MFFLNKSFRGEVWNNIDEKVLAEIVKINAEQVDGKVGQDSYTKKATSYLQSFFDKEISVLYTINGTAANIVALKALLDRFGSVICAEQAHINTYECGALEYNLGNKILTIPTVDAKITPQMIDQLLFDEKNHGYYPQVHRREGDIAWCVQPRLPLCCSARRRARALHAEFGVVRVLNHHSGGELRVPR